MYAFLLSLFLFPPRHRPASLVLTDGSKHTWSYHNSALTGQTKLAPLTPCIAVYVVRFIRLAVFLTQNEDSPFSLPRKKENEVRHFLIHTYRYSCLVFPTVVDVRQPNMHEEGYLVLLFGQDSSSCANGRTDECRSSGSFLHV